MKKALKKILVIILIILTINNFLISSVYADDDDGLGGIVGDIIQGLLESVVGLLTYPIRIIALAAATAINSLTASIAYIEGSTDPNSDMGASESLGNVFSNSISPFDIFFNKVKILDVNFFDIETTGPEAETIVNKIRLGIATWYYVLRMIALAILLVVLVYVGIRMAITTIASDKAMYKKMLLDWVTSIVLIFLIPYIITFTLVVSDSIINAISLGVNSEEITKTYSVIGEVAYRLFDIDSVAATIVYCMLVWQTLGILFSYFNRMLKIAFLVIISPLITLTYSIDKMGDGKAQALGNWLKEFVFTILIQPFHCIIYMCFINVAFSLLISDPEGNKNTMAVAVISILCVRFVKEAEKIVRKIFNFQDDGDSSLGTGLAMASMALSQSKNIGRSARSMVNGARNVASTTASGIRGIGRGVGKIAAIGVAGGAAVKNKFTKTEEQKIEKEMDRNYGGYERKENESDEQYEARRAKAVNKLAYKAQNKTAKKLAKINKKKERKEKRANSLPAKAVKGVRGTVNKVKSVYKESEVIQGAKSAAKFYTSAGLGLMGASGIYGSGGNLSTSIATGGAIYSASKEFMKNTSKTLALDAGKNLQALGTTSKKDAANKVSNIMSKFSNSDNADAELKSIMKEIKKALTEAGVDEKNATRIQNRIQSAVKANPSKTQNIIKYALTDIKDRGSDGKNLYETNDGSVRKAAQKLADFTNEKQIYETVQSAGEMGITADTFLGQVIGSYNVTASERNKRVVENSVYEYSDVDEYTESREELDEELSSMTREGLQELENEYNKKIDELRNSTSEENIDAKIRQLELEKTDIISKALSQMESDSQGVIDRMKSQYSQSLANELSRLQGELNSMPSTYTSQYRDVLEERTNRMSETLNNLKQQ